MIRPHQSSDSDHYSRLFAPFEYGLPMDELAEKLQRLADKMESNQSPMPFEILESDPVPAGYTYFGQFVDHDLTEDRTPFRLRGLIDPKDTENRRRPLLDLDQIYGHGPGCPDYERLYERDRATFRLGDVTVHGEQFDVPLDGGRPQLADDRNSENLILRQIHVLFLKLHNCALKELRQTSPGLANEEAFERAQQRVRWQYQWLVRHDYLSRICDEAVHEDVVRRGHRRIDWGNGFSIPIEFSMAAFRFGHSMVRPDYKLNDGVERMSLDKLFAEHKPGAIDPQLAVDWEEFLTTNHKPEFSMRIDRAIAKPLYSLPDASIHLFVSSSGPHGPNALPVRTLLRGAAAHLCTGQQAREQLSPESILLEPRIVKDHPYDPWEHLKKLGLADHIPLWYYVLLEAELNENGRRLGQLGSRIVLETTEGALLTDPDSFVNVHGSNWEPPPWTISSGNSIPVRTLFDVAELVGLKSAYRQH